MTDESFSLHQLVLDDPRYPVEAYCFVREALAYAADAMELGIEHRETDQDELEQSRRERHLTGQQLCEAIREYAIKQYGYMARVVLSRWSIEKTGDFGDIVYNMIKAGIMKKSSRDQRSHFDDVYCFEDAFEADFEICSANRPGKS